MTRVIWPSCVSGCSLYRISAYGATAGDARDADPETLLFGPLHGYGIAKAIHSSSREQLDIEFGSLYPALKRLELKGWIDAKWDLSEHNKRAKFYRLTPLGRKRLTEEHNRWREFVSAVAGVMKPLPGGKKS